MLFHVALATRTAYASLSSALGRLDRERKWKFEAMTGTAHGQIAGIISNYDFAPFRKIVDVSGGHGHLLHAVLSATPQSTGVLLDLPDAIKCAADTESRRLKIQAGDFFKDALPVCDTYIIMQVIHDWDDEEAGQILRAIREAAPRHAKLLLIEEVLGPAEADLSLKGPLQSTRELEPAMICLADAACSSTTTRAAQSTTEAAERTPENDIYLRDAAIAFDKLGNSAEGLPLCRTVRQAQTGRGLQSLHFREAVFTGWPQDRCHS